MVLTCQKHLFSLPDDVHYLNCATMSPLSKSVESVGLQSVLRKSKPYEITQEHFFDTLEVVKDRFASLVNCSPDSVAILPSVSYGMATVVKNLLKKRNITAQQKVLVVGEEFPSDVYSWEELTQERGVRVEFVPAPNTLDGRGQAWNERLLAAMDDTTLAVCISPTHWADGTLFDLQAIGDRCRQRGAFFAIDGTQHVGAYPFDLQKVKPDFLVCAVYKWLLGPYGNALAYFGDFFDNGTPLEQTWTGRLGSQEFKDLVNYQPQYRPGAYRFNMGESSNFIQLPMIAEALQHILDWTPVGIQEYARRLIAEPLVQLQEAGYWVETEQYRASHLFGIRPLRGQNLDAIRQALLQEKIFVSYRGSSIRISINVWNDAIDLNRLVAVLREA
ncbi:MAG: aminotransferase class V-fold PLP-dependent enzyme [Phycisphaerae bacterium]|nr:aminotransferase class V-fold PLP-dependent enzyme [Saprospiraceae bacterium]